MPSQPTIIVEVRAAEGGEHAKLLVTDQVRIYLKLCTRRDLDAEILEERPGITVLKVTGKDADRVFADEAGGHRWQAVPPNEKRGRVQTSTVTVAVLQEPTEAQVHLRPEDLSMTTCRGSGAGGQHRNVTASAVQLTHLPTGLTVRVESERSQALNRETATALLRARLWEAKQNAIDNARAALRKEQVGIGARGDKRRTIAVQRDSVVDHQTGRSWTFKRYSRGDW